MTCRQADGHIGGHAKINVYMAVMYLQTEECQGLLEATRRKTKAGKDLDPAPSEDI